jgi:hypothetical protein
MFQVVANEILTKWIPYIGRFAGASKGTAQVHITKFIAATLQLHTY